MLISKETRPVISIVCPVRNAERTIGKTLDSLLLLDIPREKMEIVLADGGSSDRTVPIIREYQQKHSFIKLTEVRDCKSPGHARNAALKLVQGDFILFTDADCAPRPDWATRILDAFKKDTKIGMVGGEILTLRVEPDNDTESYCEQTGFLSLSGRCGVPEGYFPSLKAGNPREINGSQTSPFFATANAAVTRGAALAVGNTFWDEITGEDVDFSLRLIKAGYKLYFEPGAIVEHMHRVSEPQFFKQLAGYGFGHPLLIQKHARQVLEVRFQYFGDFSLVVPFPVKGMIYVGDFHLLHVFGLFTLGSFLASFWKEAGLCPWISLLLFVFFLWKYFEPALRLKPRGLFLKWCKLRYLSNWAILMGGLKGMVRFGALDIENSF